VVKKRVTRKPAGKTKRKAAASRARGGDQSRLDLKPLQKHIRRRIKELQSGSATQPLAAGRTGESNEETIARLTSALETLEDICFPTMGIPI
jgi:hypothetical protein